MTEKNINGVEKILNITPMNAIYQPEDTICDRYCIVSLLGEGGTAITYEAIDLKVNRSAALKVLSLFSPKTEKAVAQLLEILSCYLMKSIFVIGFLVVVTRPVLKIDN